MVYIEKINFVQNVNLQISFTDGPVAIILSPSTKQYTITYGESKTPITCKADCRPLCKHTWSGPDVPYDTVNVLSLQNIQKNQSGNFICNASNEIGYIQSSISVNVQCKLYKLNGNQCAFA